MRTPALLALSLLLAAPAVAQDAATDAACTNVRVALPAELAGWSEQTPVTAGVKPGDGAAIVVGKAYAVALHPAAHLALAPAPQKPPAATTQGGAITVPVTHAGTYRIALGGPAWIDVVRDGKTIASVAHNHGPKCTGVRKLVDFALSPATYTIQLSGAPSATLALMLVKVK